MPKCSTQDPAAGGSFVPLLAAVLALGCGHTEPFTTPPTGSEQPFDATPPVRLTYNTAADRWPGWLTDGSAFLYSAQQADRADGDVCLAVMPRGGGSQRDLWCDIPAGAERRDALQSAAPAPDGRLAYVSVTGTIAGVNPIAEGIALASGLDPRDAPIVRSFPVTPPGGVAEGTAEHLRWLDATRLVYVGQQFRTNQECPTCPLDTVRVGLEVSLLDLSAPGSTPTALPGTGAASGAATGGDPDLVYYTVGGDSRVYRRRLSSGAVDVAHDFGAAGIVRDISVAGDRLAAVVGGRVTFALHPVLGQVQWDSGGELHVVNLTTGEDSFLEAGTRLFRRPALAPAGDALVAEGYPLIITRLNTTPVTFDTTVGKSADLFRFGEP